MDEEFCVGAKEGTCVSGQLVFRFSFLSLLLRISAYLYLLVFERAGLDWVVDTLKAVQDTANQAMEQAVEEEYESMRGAAIEQAMEHATMRLRW